jgi:hypothetical protein
MPVSGNYMYHLLEHYETSHFAHNIYVSCHNKLHNLYCPPSHGGWMRCAGHVARIGEKRNVYRILVGKPEGKRPLGRLDVGGRIILKWILER